MFLLLLCFHTVCKQHIQCHKHKYHSPIVVSSLFHYYKYIPTITKSETIYSAVNTMFCIMLVKRRGKTVKVY